MFASGTFDVIYATYHVDVGETPFFVVVDYEKECVVVSIRGTLSLKVKKLFILIYHLDYYYP